MSITEHAPYVYRAPSARRRRIIGEGAAMELAWVLAAVVYTIFAVAVAKFIAD